METINKQWCGLWSEPQNDGDVYGPRLIEGDTIYLLGVKGRVVFDCGAWGWGSSEYVPWDELEKRVPHLNVPHFCYNDNFISFWELMWNFNDDYEWKCVPFVSHINKEANND